MPRKLAYWKRILLGLIAIYHWALIPYTMLAWIWPQPVWLIVHLILIPALMIQWHLNRGVCILNNLESWLRTGRWHDHRDALQGRWIAGMIERHTGITLSERSANWLVYGAASVSWGISLVRLIAALG